MDKVKLYPQERLDLTDTGALQNLVYDYVQNSLGSFMGVMRGCLSQPSYTFINGTPDRVSFSDFAFVSTKAVGNDAFSKKVNFVNQIVKFDSSLTDHGNYPIDLTSVTTSMFLWARPLMVDTDEGNRRKWDVIQGTEVTFSDTTRTRMRVEFVFSVDDPTLSTDEFQYSRLAQVSLINGSLIVLQWISAFDSPITQEVLGESGTYYDSTNLEATAFSGMLPSYAASSPSTTQDINAGLVSLLHMLGRMIRLSHAKGENDPSGTSSPSQWYRTQPKISLNGAYKYLTNLTAINDDQQTAINSNSSRITTLENNLLDRGLVPFAYWIVQGNPKYASNIWVVLRGTTSLLYIDPTKPNEFKIYMNDEMKNSGFYVNGCSITQLHSNFNGNHNRVSSHFVWHEETTNNAAWIDASAGNSTFNFEVIPQELTDETNFDNVLPTNDFNNLTTSAPIKLMITLFGAPVNP